MNGGLVLEILVKSSLILGVGLLIRSAMRKENPTIRHLVLVLSIIGCLALPLAIPLVKLKTSIPVPQQFDLGISKPVLSTSSPDAPNGLPTASRTPGAASVSWQGVAAIVWLVGFVAVISRYASGLFALAKLRRNATVRTSQPVLSKKAVDNCDLNICIVPTLNSPMTWGVIRPTVLLPMEANDWTSHRVEMVLLHELAHVRRKDFVSQMLAEIACALYWFNPLVWQSAHAMREDAELAADEAVIQSGIRPTDYATELLQLAANLSRGKPVLNRVGISTMTNSKIESRLTAILSSTSNSRGITTVSVLFAIALSGIAVTTIASLKLHQDATPAQLKAEAMSRLKQVALATYMYAQDFDNVLPNSSSTSDARKVLTPYIKSTESFKSPRLGAEFRYNLNLSGVDITTLRSPAESILWYEATPKGLEPNAAFVDGHVTTITSQNARAFARALQQKYPRAAGTQSRNGIGR